MIEKILIKTPSKLNDLLRAYPFLHQLREEFPKVEITVIANVGQRNFMRLLPLGLRVFEIGDEYLSKVGIHKYAFRLNEVFNIDLFFDLDGNTNSAFLGQAFKARIRVGYKEGFRKFFYTHKIESNEFSCNEARYLNLLYRYLDKEQPAHIEIGKDFSFSSKPKIEPLFNIKDEVKFFTILINELADHKRIWRNFLMEFDDQKLLFWYPNNDLAVENLVNEFPHKANCLVERSGDYEKLIYVIENGVAVITDIEWVAVISSYYCAKTIYLNDGNDLPLDFSYFKSKPVFIKYEQDKPTEIEFVGERHKVNSEKQVADFLYDLYQL